MRAVVQRVARAEVRVDGECVGRIGAGLLALVGVAEGDRREDAAYIADKLAHLRLFGDERGRMELSARDQNAAVLVVSQFTLLGDARKGRRPSYTEAARPETAQPLYEEVCRLLREQGLQVETGRFGAMMEVEAVGDGPVTVLLDSRRVF